MLGLLGGLHCAGMCGPLMLALPVVGSTTGRYVAGRVAYHLGRVMVYGMMGVLAGALGRSLAMAGVQQAVSITLGTAMLAGLFLAPRFLEMGWMAGWVGRLQRVMGGFLRQRTAGSLLVLGGLNGLLPCGLVYAAFAGAAATDSVMGGVQYMVVFGLGTLPVMLAISLTGHLVPMAWRLKLRHLVPVSMGLVGVLLVLRGLSLGIPYVSPDLAAGGAGCCHPTVP